VSYATYMTERLTGFEGESRPTRAQVDAAAFPEFYRVRGMNPNTIRRPVCNGPSPGVRMRWSSATSTTCERRSTTLRRRTSS
jgi:hypothetical protein